MQGASIPDIYQHKRRVCARAGERGRIQLVVAGTTPERAVRDRIAAMCDDAGARYLGDVRGTEKAELLAGARAVLFPTRLHEGLPLVIIEALLSGTPVIASDSGACPELVTPEVGFVCADRAAFRRAIDNVGRIRPQACRATAVHEFHYRRMAAGYIREYERELGRGAQSRLHNGASLPSRSSRVQAAHCLWKEGS